MRIALKTCATLAAAFSLSACTSSLPPRGKFLAEYYRTLHESDGSAAKARVEQGERLKSDLN